MATRRKKKASKRAASKANGADGHRERTAALRVLVNRYVEAGEHDAARVLHAVAEGCASELASHARRALRSKGRDNWQERAEALDALLVRAQAMLERDAPPRAIATTLLCGIAVLAPGLALLGPEGIDRTKAAACEKKLGSLRSRDPERALRVALASAGVTRAQRESLLAYRRNR